MIQVYISLKMFTNEFSTVFKVQPETQEEVQGDHFLYFVRTHGYAPYEPQTPPCNSGIPYLVFRYFRMWI